MLSANIDDAFGIIDLILAAIFLYGFIRLANTNLSEDGRLEAPIWVKKLIESKSGVLVRSLLSLLLWVSLSGIIGIIIWEAIKGVAGTVTASFEVFVAASVGATASMISFALFALVLGLLGPILAVAYEEWIWYIAPVIGGTVGAAISGGLAINVIYIVTLSALTGGLTSIFRQAITAKEKVTFKNATELAIAGVGLGAINGIIVAGVFKVLEATVGIDWMLAG